MSKIPNRLRRSVQDRARGRCEYCLIPTRAQVAPFPIDHIEPESAGGRTISSNLALSCPRCNSHKWSHRKGTDPVTGRRVPLFNPRRHKWATHFRWSTKNPFTIEGKTVIGRATVRRLRMNHPHMVLLRKELTDLGIEVVEPGRR